MNKLGQAERAPQNRAAAVFRDEPGWRYLGAWSAPR